MADSYVQVVGGDVMRFAYRYREYESNLITYLIFRIRKFWLFNLRRIYRLVRRTLSYCRDWVLTLVVFLPLCSLVLFLLYRFGIADSLNECLFEISSTVMGSIILVLIKGICDREKDRRSRLERQNRMLMTHLWDYWYHLDSAAMACGYARGAIGLNSDNNISGEHTFTINSELSMSVESIYDEALKHALKQQSSSLASYKKDLASFNVVGWRIDTWSYRDIDNVIREIESLMDSTNLRSVATLQSFHSIIDDINHLPMFINSPCTI